MYDMDERYNILCACVGQLIQSRLKNNIPMRADITIIGIYGSFLIITFGAPIATILLIFRIRKRIGIAHF